MNTRHAKVTDGLFLFEKGERINIRFLCSDGKALNIYVRAYQYNRWLLESGKARDQRRLLSGRNRVFAVLFERVRFPLQPAQSHGPHVHFAGGTDDDAGLPFGAGTEATWVVAALSKRSWNCFGVGSGIGFFMALL